MTDVMIDTNEMTDSERDRATLERMLQCAEQDRTFETESVTIVGVGTFVLRGLDEDEFMRTANTMREQGEKDPNVVKASAEMVARALVSPHMNAAFLEKLRVPTVADALRVTLKPGHIVKLGDVVSKLTGLGEEDFLEQAGN